MDSQQTARSPGEFSTGQKPPMVKQNPSIPISPQNQQALPQSGAPPHLISSGPRFPVPNNNPVDGSSRFQHPGGPPPLRHLDSRSQLNSGGPQGQFPPPRPPYGPPLQRAPPPRNVFFGRPPPPGSLPSGPPPQPGSLPSGPPSSQPGSFQGSSPPQPGSFQGALPTRFPPGQAPPTGPQGQVLGPRLPQPFNQSGFINRPPFQPPGIASNDPRIPNRGLLQRNNSVGGIAVDPRLIRPNFSPDQRQQNDWRNQFRPQLSVDKMADIDVSQQRPFSSTLLKADDNYKSKNPFDIHEKSSEIKSENKAMEDQRSINNDILDNLKKDELEKRNNTRFINETQNEIFSKDLVIETSDRKITDIESPMIKVQESIDRRPSGFEKSKDIVVTLPDINTKESLRVADVEDSEPQSPIKTPTILKGFDNEQKESDKPTIYPPSKDLDSSSIQLTNTDKEITLKKKASLAELQLTKFGENDTSTQRDPVIATTLKKSPSTKSIKTDAENDSGVDESTQRREIPKMNGLAGSPKKSHEGDKRSTASSPIKSPSKSIKSLPKTPDAAPSSNVQEKKKVPMNKVQVGAAPSPNLKSVRSKIGSLDNTTYKPGGGNVKIENRKLDFSKAQPKIAAKNDKYIPSGGDKKIQQVKLQWNAKPKIGSLDNAAYKPGGGDKKIESVKLDFKDKAKPKVGSKENAKHVPGGGSVKSSLMSSKMPQNTIINIETQKIEIKAESKIGSLDNVKYKPGGGDKKIFDDKTYLRQTSSNVGSMNGSGSQSPIPSSASIINDKNDLPISDENLNREC